MILHTKEDALNIVNNYVPNSIRFEDDGLIFNLIILTDNFDLNKTLHNKYKIGEIKSEEVAELYGNGQNLQVFAVRREYYNHLRI